MDVNGQSTGGKNLMDEIAADPEIINRSAVGAGDQPVAVKPTPDAPVASAPSPMAPNTERMGNLQVAPNVNLLAPNGLGEPAQAKPATPKPAGPKPAGP